MSQSGRRGYTHLHPPLPSYSSKCNVVIKVEVYKSQNGFTQCYNCQCLWPHLGALQAVGVGVDISVVSAQRRECSFQLVAVVTCKMGNRRTQQVTDAAVMQNGNYSAEGTCGQQHGSAGRMMILKYTSDRSLTTALHSSD